MLFVQLFLVALLSSGMTQTASTYINDDQQETEAIDTTIETADQLLDALEAASEKLADFSASIRYTKEQGLMGEVQVRTGTIDFQQVQDSNTRKFFVHFDELRIGNAVSKESRDYIFDGRYLVERLNDEHQFIKREVVKTGQDFDPFALDGPFPLPIGQAKKAILKRFDAQLLEPETNGRLQGFPHLRLNARNAEVEDSNENILGVELWYDPATWLPLKAIVTETNGDISQVELAKVQINTGLSADRFSTQTPPTSDGWHITIDSMDQ